MLSDFPQPDADALAHSDRLVDHIRRQIGQQGGRISFADYMQLALYAPGLGYYSAGATKFGAGGDFVTAPEISAFFSQCVAGQCAEVLRALGGGVLLEPGAGRGVMAADILAELDRLDCLPEEYLILEPSADLRERQAALISERVPELAGLVHWLDHVPDKSVRGVVVANEVADALPVERFTMAAGQVQEVGVSVAGERFAASLQPAAGELLKSVQAVLQDLGQQLPDGYNSEVCLQLAPWVQALGGWLEEGVVLLFDYGFSRREYYLPERCAGTLRCYYRHRAHDDPFVWPGLQDITAWVDFSRLAEAAAAAAMEVAGYTTQAHFLLAAGLDERVAAVIGDDAQAQAEFAHGLRQLLLPGEMGDAIKVMALTKGNVSAPTAMLGRDMRSAL